MDVWNYYITWIGTDGSVLYDSVANAYDMENHFEQEEVKEAFAEWEIIMEKMCKGRKKKCIQAVANLSKRKYKTTFRKNSLTYKLNCDRLLKKFRRTWKCRTYIIQ